MCKLCNSSDVWRFSAKANLSSPFKFLSGTYLKTFTASRCERPITFCSDFRAVCSGFSISAQITSGYVGVLHNLQATTFLTALACIFPFWVLQRGNSCISPPSMRSFGYSFLPAHVSFQAVLTSFNPDCLQLSYTFYPNSSMNLLSFSCSYAQPNFNDVGVGVSFSQ